MDTYFLAISLFFPRLTLLFCILFSPGAYPANAVPQWADILLGLFVPRILILIYIYQNLGYENVWFIVHLIALVLAYAGGGRETSRRRRTREA